MTTYLLVTRSPHAIPLKPLHILWDVAEVNVEELEEAFEHIARAILALPEDDYVLIQAGLPALCSFASLMLYQRFRRVRVAQFNIATREYHIYDFPRIRQFM